MHVVVHAAVMPPGGAFAPLGSVSPEGEDAGGSALDVAPGGAATIVWRLTGTEGILQSSTLPSGEDFAPPVTVNSGTDNPRNPEVSVSDEGDTIVTWSGDDGATDRIAQAAVRPAGSAAFGAPVAISMSSAGEFHPHPAMDAGGDATVVWERSNGTFRIAQWAGYDADPPQLGAVSIPSSATVGETVPFSASASDVWPVGKPSFDFGDGAQADGDLGLPRLLGAGQLPGDGDRQGCLREDGDPLGNAAGQGPQPLHDRQAEAEPQEGHRDPDRHDSRTGRARRLRQGDEEGDRAGGKGGRREGADQSGGQKPQGPEGEGQAEAEAEDLPSRPSAATRAPSGTGSPC